MIAARHLSLAVMVQALAMGLGAATVNALNSECHLQGEFDFRGPGPWPIILSMPADGCHRLSFEGGSHMRYTKLFIERHPAHGRLTLHQGGYYSFVPKPGFKGRDAFHLEICRINRRQEEQCTAMHFEVRVR
jgi:hypothetical protein